MVFFISLSSFSSLLTGTPDLAPVGGLYNNSSYRIYLKRANVNFCCLQGRFFFIDMCLLKHCSVLQFKMI